MTLEEFIETLDKRAKPGDFVIDWDNSIRTPDGVCPVVQVANWLGLNPCGTRCVPHWTDLVLDGINKVMAAADNDMDTDLRIRLLKACKIDVTRHSPARTASGSHTGTGDVEQHHPSTPTESQVGV